MTEEAQPSPADDGAWRRPDAPPEYHVPSYDLSGDRQREERPAEPPAAPAIAPAAQPVAPPIAPPPPPPMAPPSPPLVAPAPVAPFPAYAPAGSPAAASPYAPAGSPVAANPYPPGSGSPPPNGYPGPYGAGGPPAHGRPGQGWVPPPPREAWHAPRRVEAVPGTAFGVVHLNVPPVTSGLAIGALVVGIASIFVALLVGCFGIVGAETGGSGWAAGAFAVLGVFAGAAAILLGVLGLRQVRHAAPPPAVRFSGRGLAIAGVSCGGTGLGVTVLALAVSLILQAS